LGEPLKAEIDILDINAEEAASLSSKVASPGAFKAAGLEFNPALTSLQATLLRRPDGRAFIKLSSDRAVTEPFVDMIIETSWNSGRIVRDYTMLFDPPSLRSGSAATPTTAQLPAQATAPSLPKASTATRELPPSTKPAVATPKAPPVAQAPKRTATQSPSSGQTVTVKPGDTASRIAAANKPASVSLDQMLVALLRSNPDAFIRDNVNRIKAGAVITLPSEEQVNVTSATQASQIIVAQSQDFNDFRRKFASNAPNAQMTPTSRDVSGKIQATVEDKKPAATTPDKLTLSKGTVQGKTNEDQLAQARNVKETANRASELTKNINDLNKLAAASSVPSAAVTTPAASAGKDPLPSTAAVSALPAAASAPTAPASTSASAPQPAPAASEPASAPAMAKASAPKKLVALPKPPEPLPEPSLMDTVMDNLIPIGGVGLVIALLAGLGFYKSRQRKNAAELDSAFVESKLRADTFSGVSGGQNVDTSDSLTTGSSMVYSPSQLDAVDDVDPVAEADVYLAYGRDLQAEEILKDALRSNPKRVAIHHKLLEIYAKRRDAKAFEAIATLAFNLTDGTGPDWEHICEKGLSIDPDNALYLPGGQPTSESGAPTVPSAMENSPLSPTPVQELEVAAVAPMPADSSLDLDLDLDFSLDDPIEEPKHTQTAAPELHLPDFAPSSNEFTDPLPTISHDMMQPVEPEPEELHQDPIPSTLADTLDFSMPLPTSEPSFDSADLNKTQPEPIASTEVAAVPHPDTDLMSFDLGSLSLDLGEGPITEPGGFIDSTQDPLETKLALAEEFQAIGDDDGARALIEEVIAEAGGAMKAKAQRALSKL
jgi:pilus assembly protein FimV